MGARDHVLILLSGSYITAYLYCICLKTMPETSGEAEVRPVALVGDDLAQVAEDGLAHVQRGKPLFRTASFQFIPLTFSLPF